MKPKHVKEFEYAKKHNTVDSLEWKWLDGTMWKITALGKEYVGKLCNINNGMDVFFTIEITDPNDENCTLSIKAPFEQFVQVEQEN